MKEFCVDLEIAKELKENGYSQISEFYHRIQKDNIGEFTDFSSTNLKSDFMTIVNVYSAPCSDEILKELPRNINNFDLNILWVSEEKTWAITYDMKNNLYTYDFILHHALAKMWLYLKKEGYIK